MRTAIYLIFLLMVTTGCTSMLLGGGSSSDNRPGTSAGTDVSPPEDDEISAEIRAAYSADPKLNQYTINVRTVDGHIIISGTVGSYSARDRAVELASGIIGTHSVSYRIAVNTALRM